MKRAASRTAIAALLQALALVMLLLACLGVHWLEDTRPGLLVLVDRSLSVPRPAADAALATIRREAPQRRIDTIEFAGRVAAPQASRATEGDTGPAGEVAQDLDPTATNLELAIEAALADNDRRPYAAVVIVSDGRSNAGDAGHALEAAKEAGLPLLWVDAARAMPRAWIADVQTPDRARRGQPFEVVVSLAGERSAGLRVTAVLRDSSGADRRITVSPDPRGFATIPVTAERGGALRVSLSLEDAESGAVLDSRRDAAAIDVIEAARILYLRGSAGPLAASLTAGGWEIESAPARRASDFRERLRGYEAVVLDDVARDDIDDGFWQALAAEVRLRGLGLLVLGGERAFARGGYRDSTLESVLPVISEPASLDPPVHVVFAIDKSGSMGEGSRGVDRLSLAERAVLDTLDALGARDTAGVVAFDVEPRLLEALGPAPVVKQALAGGWPIAARGGTRLAPAIELAAGQLEASGPGRRMLILVTDGFVDDAPLESLHRRLESSRIETIALAVGPDADVAALERLTGTGGGIVLRVAEAAELPATVSTGLQRRRARIERGVLGVSADSLPERLSMLGRDWPPIHAYAVTRPRPEATAWARSALGDPVVAAWQAGAGRVIAVTSGLGPWTPQWLHWKAWPDLSGGLVDWVTGNAARGASSLHVRELPDGLRVELDRARDGKWAADGSARVVVQTPTGQSRDLEVKPVAPGRLAGTLPATESGPYRFVVTDDFAVLRALHLRGSDAEQEGWGVDPRVEQWIDAGLLHRWNSGVLESTTLQAGRSGNVPDRGLTGLALFVFCAGIVVDRLRGRRAQPVSAAWRAMRLAWSRRIRPKPSRS
jgi:Ca-activated chloride channel family protein